MWSSNSSERSSSPRSSSSQRSSESTATSEYSPQSLQTCDPANNLKTEIRSICCVGAGYVGGPTAAVIALQNPHIRVTVVDKDSARIAKWNSRHLPIHEPGLYEVVRRTRDGCQSSEISDHTKTSSGGQCFTRTPNLFFSTDVAKNISEADLIFVSVNTPTKTRGIGAGKATNMAAFESATKTVAQYASPGAIIVEKSTVPVRTAQMIREIFSVYQPDEKFEILSNPEFLAEGTAIQDLLCPDRILIGSMPTPAGRVAAAALADVYAAWVDPSKILTTNIWSSELAKLTANAMLAQRISSINSISVICEQVGADVQEISRAIGLDQRIGGKFLRAGIGFGGSCFKKDILSLTYLAYTLDLPEIAEYWEQVLILNDFQRDRFVHRVLHKLNGTLTGKKVAVLGYAFKKDTNDSRESPAIDVVMQLLAEGAREIAIFDPQCSSEQIRKELGAMCTARHMQDQFNQSIRAYDVVYDALKDASATLILTDWDQFRFVSGEESKATLTKSTNNVSKAFEVPKLQNQPSLVTPWSQDFLSVRKETPCPPGCTDCIRSSVSNAGVHDSLDWHAVRDLMSQPRWVFDGRGVVDADALEAVGFRVESIGRMSSRPVVVNMARPQVSRTSSSQTL